MPAAAVDYPEAGSVAGLVRRAGILAVARFANQALVIVSPIILVRLLSVAEFGRYREFLLLMPNAAMDVSRPTEAVRAMRHLHRPIGAES